MQQKETKVMELFSSWEIYNRKTRTIVFCLTEDCNLIYKYCCMVLKNNKGNMTFETAKKAVDYILSDRESFPEEAVVWSFIGQEPLLEVGLLDKITDYIKQQMSALNHPWLNAYRFSFVTNGALYNDLEVQKYIDKNRNHLFINFNIDENRIRHGLQTTCSDGFDSYDTLINMPYWVKQLGKVTTKYIFSRKDLTCLKDIVVNIWNMEIKDIIINAEPDEFWHDGDDIIFESQLYQLAECIVENKMWDRVSVSFFQPNIGLPLSRENERGNLLNTGDMVAIGYDGKLYTSTELSGFPYNKKESLCIGDIEKGVNANLTRLIYGLSYDNLSTQECKNCSVAGGCIWRYNYDESEEKIMQKRNIYNCRMHKANARVNEYFWRRYSEVTGKQSPRNKRFIKIMRENEQKYKQIV